MSDQVFGFGCTSRTIKHPARYPESIKIYIPNELKSLMYINFKIFQTRKDFEQMRAVCALKKQKQNAKAKDTTMASQEKTLDKSDVNPLMG